MTRIEQLSSGLAALNLNVPMPAQFKLMEYIDLLAKWNRVHNLTAIREPDQMVSHHLLDSLAIQPALVECKNLVDVGTGAGLPGIPLALTRPDLRVTLLDSSHKKTAFLRQVKVELALDNVEIVCDRVEAWRPTLKFDAVVSRAFADLAEFAQLANHLVRDSGMLLAMKGVYPFDEIARLPDSFQLNRVMSLHVPQLSAERHLIVLDKAA
jgi:16S rRNA (guanine527-N7)-methyltransferase